jgi:GTP-binding protein EngB required for normal cell division
MLSLLKNTGEIPVEIEEGNTEYKLKIKSFNLNDDSDNIRFKKLTSQLSWRLNEGKQLYSKNIATYILGITNDGKMGKVNEETINESIKSLDLIAKSCHSQITNITKEYFDTKYCVAQIIIQKYNDIFIKEIRVCFFGNINSGKTTMISHLCSGHKDNGNGSGRSTIMRHVHEQISGSTSSICHELIGYNGLNLINYKTSKFGSWEKIVNHSDFIVSLIDLPGSQKYIRTTIYGLLSRRPHLSFLTIAIKDCYGDDGQFIINNNLIELFKLLHYYGTKIIIIFTKNDWMNNDYSFLIEFKKILIKNINISNISLVEFDNNIDILDNNIIPYILISNITGEGYDNIHQLFNTCIENKLYNSHDTQYDNSNIKFLFGEIYSQCNEFISNEKIIIASGLLVSGIINVGDILNIGPYNNKFYPIIVKNIHKKQIDCKTFNTHEYGSLEIEFIDEIVPLDNHMILVNMNSIINLVNTCKIKIYHGLEYIKIKKSYSLHSDNIVESCSIIEINNDIITVKFNRLPDIQICIFSGNKCILKCENYLFGLIL